MEIGDIKKGDMTDFEWFLLLAENGHSSYQYILAAEIFCKNVRPDKNIQAYKWLFLSALLGEPRAREVADFVCLGMSEMEIVAGDKLVENWLEDKFESGNEIDKSGWSKELRMFLQSSKDDF